MSNSLNKVTLIGNLSAAPEIKALKSGDRVANIRLATSDSWRDQNTGELREKTEWHNITIFNETIIKFCEKYVKKGDKVYVEGQLQTRKWQDKNGTDHYTTEIVLLKFDGELLLLNSSKNNAKTVTKPETETEID